jgi:hypothetical protein
MSTNLDGSGVMSSLWVQSLHHSPQNLTRHSL